MDDYKNLKRFWDNNFKLTDEAKNEILEYDSDDYEILAPSKKLIDACKLLSQKNKILDYGAGFGFASIIASRNEAKDITAFDTSENAKKLALYYANYFKANNINYISGDDNWLKNEEDNKYDGIICSNVLDVLPIEITKDIIKNLCRVAKKDALIIIGLNYYVDGNKIPLHNGLKTNYLYIDGVLRLMSLKDEEWINLFKDYFIIDKLDYFSWPGEEEEKRRLFYLRKK